MSADDVSREVTHGSQALTAARALIDLKLFNDALTRTYYAAFHYACALLLTEGVEPRRHRSLPGLIAAHLAGAGFDASDAARLGRLSTYRDMADYERAFDATEELAKEALADAEAFIRKASDCLRDRGAVSKPPTS